MKNKKSARDNLKGEMLPIPELDVIDLEQNDNPAHEASALPRESRPGSAPQNGGKKFPRINLHIILLIVVILFISGIVYKFLNFGVKVDRDEIFKDGPGTYEDNYDTILPLMDADNNPVYKQYGEGDTILFFGNAPFADDRDSADNLVNMIQEMTGITAYNCSISGSYLAAQAREPDPEKHPVDVFNLYWLCSLATEFHDFADENYRRAVEVLGENAPKEAMDVYNTLKSIDMNEVDAIVIMYDASDYLAGHEMYSDTDSTDLIQFTGNMEASIELLRFCYPDIRLMVLSPTYAFGIDENGDYISSDIQRYGWDVLSTYSIKQYASCASRAVTFVDNLYGTITEDNAKDYLTDNLHLNVEGRKKVAQRFVYALNYYKERN